MGYTSRKRTWPGDSIVEVNGVRGDVANMLQKCKVIPSIRRNSGNHLRCNYCSLRWTNITPETLGLEDEFSFGARPPGRCCWFSGGVKDLQIMAWTTCCRISHKYVRKIKWLIVPFHFSCMEPIPSCQHSFIEDSEHHTTVKFNSSPLKNDGWQTADYFPFGKAHFQGPIC